MGAILDPQDVRANLLDQELFDEPDCPSLAGIANVIDNVEDWMAEWLDQDFFARDYIDELYRVNHKGYVSLLHYPVVEVISASYAIVGLDLFQPIPVSYISRLRRGHQSLSFGTRFIGRNVKISYHASNLEENGRLPRVFYRAAMQIVLRALERSGTSGDLLFLSDPTRDTSSISLPGGLSESYQLGKAAGLQGGIAGEGDRLMKELNPYRRVYLCSS